MIFLKLRFAGDNLQATMLPATSLFLLLTRPPLLLLLPPPECSSHRTYRSRMQQMSMRRRCDWRDGNGEVVMGVVDVVEE
jgi:hypothetical protein